MARAFALVSFALVVGPGGGVGAQRGEGRQEHGSLESFVSGVVDVLALDRGPRPPGHGARPAYEASWAPDSKVLPRVSARKIAAVLIPIPGVEVRTS